MKVCSIEGCASKHRGARGFCNKHYLTLRRLGNPLAAKEQRERFTGSVTRHGYLSITKNRRKRQEHDLIAEKVLGKQLPEVVQVHHVDHDRLNNSHTNLVICPNQAYHSLLHRREKALDACGNANYRACWICQQYWDPAKMGLNNGAYHHHQCRRERDRRTKNEQQHRHIS